MSIFCRLTRLIRVIDAFSNIPVDGAVVRADNATFRFLGKGDGFYATTYEASPDTMIQIEKLGYIPTALPFDSPEETVLLIPSDLRRDYQVLQCRASPLKNKPVQYGVLQRTASNVVLEADLGESEKMGVIPMRFSEKNSFAGREVAFEGLQDIIKIRSYDFDRQGYIPSVSLKQSPEPGSFACIVQAAQTDKQGYFTVNVGRELYQKQKSITILLIAEGKQTKKTVNTGEVEEPLVFTAK